MAILVMNGRICYLVAVSLSRNNSHSHFRCPHFDPLTVRLAMAWMVIRSRKTFLIRNTFASISLRGNKLVEAATYFYLLGKSELIVYHHQ